MPLQSSGSCCRAGALLPHFPPAFPFLFGLGFGRGLSGDAELAANVFCFVCEDNSNLLAVMTSNSFIYARATVIHCWLANGVKARVLERTFAGLWLKTVLGGSSWRHKTLAKSNLPLSNAAWSMVTASKAVESLAAC